MLGLRWRNQGCAVTGVAAIAAGGRGSRFKSGGFRENKLLVPVAGRPILSHLIGALRSTPDIDRILLMTRHDADRVEEAVADWGMRDIVEFLPIDAEETGAAVCRVAEALDGGPFLYTDGDVLATPPLYRDLAAGLVNAPERSHVSISSHINTTTHLMITPAGAFGETYQQGLRGELGTHVSLGVVAMGSILSRHLASTSEARDLDEVLEDALKDPHVACTVDLYDGPWVALHDRDDLPLAERFLCGEVR
jgi:hypothetical protein